MIRKLDQVHYEKDDPAIGDCLQTCVAMLLGLEREEVPHFVEKHADWYTPLARWLSRRGWSAMWYGLDIRDETQVFMAPRGYWVGVVKSRTDQNSHAVVMRGRRVYHDPSPVSRRNRAPYEYRSCLLLYKTPSGA